ncbi:hypothetical protein SAV14893_071090 [Streptomyces avermitilis]|uniref:ABC transmembrane type-1 domain-containing protein n=1 Tax=Streptomyces avermitilis TaxID=33903 RepID=A0A4D4M716_STRAX|nr:hypothetical protein SAV14893_071090 [Streptomyces avermitilis]
MNTLTGAWDWLTDPANWAGADGIWHRLVQHLVLTVVCLVISCLIALPVALVLGHLGKGGALAVNISNVGRAVPTFAVLVLLLLTPLGKWGRGRRWSPWSCSPCRRCSPTRTSGCGRSTAVWCGPPAAWA